MKGTTHFQFSIGFSYIVAIILDWKFNFGLNFYLMAILFPLLAAKGTKFPDYDHHWDSISEKTTFSWITSTLIHATGGSHRSKHTHSWDICLISLALLCIGAEQLEELQIFTEFDHGVALIILLGFYSGWISHLVSDMFNGVGVYPSVFCKKKIAFVPKQLFGIRFNTGGAWEKFFFTYCKYNNKILEVIVVLYPWIKNGILLRVLNTITN